MRRGAMNVEAAEKGAVSKSLRARNGMGSRILPFCCNEFALPGISCSILHKWNVVLENTYVGTVPIYRVAQPHNWLFSLFSFPFRIRSRLIIFYFSFRRAIEF
jgi:hypothetical protein